MELGVVLLDAGAPDDFKILLLPVKLKGPGDGLHESLVAFKDLKRAGDAPHGEESRVGGSESGVGVSQALPVRESPGTGNTQGIVGCATDRDGMSGLLLGEA